MPSGRRVNARLAPAARAELGCLVRKSGVTLTEVIRTAIHRHYPQRRAPASSVADAFADLIGTIAVLVDWSSDVNKALSGGLGRKHACSASTSDSGWRVALRAR